MQINKQIKRLLSQETCGDEALMYLLAIYHGLNLSIIPNAIKNKVNRLNIVSRDLTTQLPVWHIPLYEGQKSDEPWQWVKDWVQLFKQVNPDRAGTWRYVVGRMKTFFQENPDVRSHEVMGATKLYLQSLNDPQYCMKSHKFIFDGSGKNKNSQLANYVAIYRKDNSRLRNNNIMK